MRVNTAALRAAAKRLQDEAADDIGRAAQATGSTERQQVIGFAFDHYGSGKAYDAVSTAWRGELAGLAESLRQLAAAMDAAAENYDRADAAASGRVETIR